MIGELGEGAGDRFAGKQILCLERFAIRRQNELGFGPRRGGAGPKCIQLGGHIASVGEGNVDVAGLQDAANVRLVRRPGTELPAGSFLISERFYERERELIPVYGCSSQRGYGFFNFDRRQEQNSVALG